jgi:hypothetical protein
VNDEAEAESFRERLSTAGEEALGEIAQALLDNPLFNQALATALGAGERALAAQRSAMSALSIPSASDVERLERRLRSVSNRLEVMEDRLDEIEDAAAAANRRRRSERARSERSRSEPAGSERPGADQERLTVSEPDS